MLKYSFDSSNNAKTILEHGNVGIGLTNPLFHLDVSGDINISGTINQAGSEYIGSQWTTVNTDEIHYSTGSVGIGTASPSNKLTINGTNSDTVPILGLRSGNNNTVINNGAQIAFGYSGTDDYQHFIHTRHNGNNVLNAIDFYVCDGTQNNTVTSGSVHNMSLVSGNVGIGTTSPDTKLHILGGDGTHGGKLLIDSGVGSDGGSDGSNSANYNATLYLRAGGEHFTHRAQILFSTAYPYDIGSRDNYKAAIIVEGKNTHSRSKMHFCLNNTASNAVSTGPGAETRMVIDSGGNIGIGTTSPAYPFVLWTSQTTQQDTGYNTGNPDNYSTNVNPDGAHNYNLAGFGSIYGFGDKDYFSNDNVFSGTYAYGLSLFAKGGLYTRGALISASDRRIKTNIVDISDNEALNTLRLIEPKKYEYIDKREKGNATTFGFIAQQIREVLPDAVKIEQDEINCFMDDSSLSEDNILTLSKTNTSDISFNYTDSSGNCYAILTVDNYLPNKPNTQSYIHVYDSNIIDSSNIQIDVSLNENYKIRECCTDASFNVNDMSGNNLYTIPANTILLNGQRVPDFHTLNKSAIFTVATAALQEVDRQLQSEKTKTATLETQVTDLLARVTALESA